MQRTGLLQALPFALAAFLAAGSSSLAADKQSHAVHWAYSGKLASANWGSLSDEFSVCSSGQRQSPVDLGTALKPAAGPLSVHYRETPLQIVNNSHTIQVDYAPGSYAELGGKRYDLAQFHFHSPSEHTVAGKHFDMEAHLVHRDTEGKLAVVGVFLKKGQELAALKGVWENLPKSEAEKTVAGVTADATALLPAHRAYYSYSGSLTTPPCSEGVSWFVIAEPVEVSAEQIEAFRAIVSRNARPVQPLNGRGAKHH